MLVASVKKKFAGFLERALLLFLTTNIATWTVESHMQTSDEIFSIKWTW